MRTLRLAVVGSFAVGTLALLASCGSGGGGGGGVGGLVTLTTPSVAPAATGVAYSQQFEADFPNAPGVFLVTGGSLPPGVSLDHDTGVLSGYPRQTGTYHFQLAARDGVDSHLPAGRDENFAQDVKNYALEVSLGLPHILPQTPSGATYRASYGYQIDVAGGTAPYTFAQTGGTLPNGLTVSPTGFLGSFPTQAQPTPYLFDVTVTDANGLTNTASMSVQVIVLPLIILTSSPLPEAALGFPYDLTLALASAGGGAPITWSQHFPLAGGEIDLALIGMTVTSSGHLVPTGTGPSSLGTFTFTVEVTDEASQHALRQLSLKVNPGPVLTLISPKSASAPGPFTATGLNFQLGAVLIVKPGPTQTTITPAFVSPTTLTFNGPIPKPINAAGSVPVKVQNPDGGNSTLNNALTFPATTLTFGTKGFIPSTLSSTGLDVLDVNNDGFADIVHCGTAGQTVYIGSPASTNAGLIFHLSNGGTPPTFSSLTLDTANYYDVKFADVNVDGKPDIVALGASSIRVWLGNGNGTFSVGPTSSLPGGFSWPSEMWIDRYNSDAIPDIAFGVSNWPSPNTTGRVYTMVGTGTGAFTLADSAITGLPNTFGVISLAAADSDGDGRAEIIAGVGMGDYINSTPCAYSATSASALFTGWTARGPIMNGNGINPYYASSTGITAGDFLGAGNKQVMVFTSGSPGWSFYEVAYLFSGSGLSTATKWPSPVTTAKCCAVLDGDFDAKMECVVSITSSRVHVYRGSTQAIALTLDATVGSPGISTPQLGRVACGDINGDGEPDIVATTSYWQTNGMAANYNNSAYSMANTGNGGSMGLVFWLNTSN